MYAADILQPQGASRLVDDLQAQPPRTVTAGCTTPLGPGNAARDVKSGERHAPPR